MEYPGVRLGQRGGLFDLYQYYLGGGDDSQDTTDPVTQVPTTTGGDGGGGGIDPFAERDVRNYLPRDEKGFQIQPGSGSGIFSKEYQPNQNFAEYFSGVKGTPSFSGLVEQEEDPGKIKSFFDKIKGGISSINLGNFPSFNPGMLLSKFGRPADAIYSYGGDKMGVGSRTGLTFNEVRNMEYLEDFGGVNQYGQDIYGKNVVSGFGDYEQGVKDSIEQIEKTLLNAQKKYGGLTDEYYDQTELIRQKLKDYKGFIDKVEADDKKTEEEIKTKNLMTDVDNYLDYTVPTTVLSTKNIVDVDLTKKNIAEAEAKAQKAAEDKAAANRMMQQQIAQAEAIASSSQGIQNAGNQASSSGGGQDSGGGGGAAAGMGGGSQQATSAGSTNSGRSDGGWGWKDGGLVQRKPYGDGGIVDLL